MGIFARHSKWAECFRGGVAVFWGFRRGLGVLKSKFRVVRSSRFMRCVRRLAEEKKTFQTAAEWSSTENAETASSWAGL